MKKMRGIVALCVALTMTAGTTALLAQKDDNKKEVKRSKAEQVDFDTLTMAVDSTVEGHPAAAADIAVTWDSNHFFRAPDGSTYVPFTVTIDKGKLGAPNAAVYLAAFPKGAAAAAAPAKGKDTKTAGLMPAFDKFDFVALSGDGKLSRYLQVKPGDYDVYLAVKDKGTAEKIDKNYTPRVALLKKEVTVPDFGATGLTTSSMLLSSGIQPAPAGQTADNDPYIFGQMQIVPSKDGKYKKTDTLSLVYWVYGATGDPGGKPDLTIENSFNTKGADGAEKFFNKTQPQSINASSPYTAAQGVPNFLEVPLLSFAPGDYRLEVKITDKPSGKTVTQNVNITVTAS
jgi:hypothetical protein